jgi:ATP-dependent DNA helicase RecQ
MDAQMASTSNTSKSLEQALKDHFGFETFRTGQREIVEAVLAGTDVLAVMPTGAGKSLCYQLPACMIDGTALVVSPLVALMKDQLDALLGFGVAATLINSSISYAERKDRIRSMVDGAYDLVYIAPERFRNDRFRQALSEVDIGLLAVDEAHCISQWGHDFRPDYLTLGDIRDELGDPVTMALTATATTLVQRDILEQLQMGEADVVVSGFERPNLLYEVVETIGHEEKVGRIEKLLNFRRGESVVVYCATRRQVDDVSRSLKSRGWLASSYHAGLSDRQRAQIQDAFMAGDLPVLVATNAFGMGVDKADVRAIVHYNIPGSLEAYYQEAGRAGRDGEPAECVVLFNSRDAGIHEFFVENSFPKKEIVERVWLLLFKRGVDRHEIGADKICDHLNRAGQSRRINSWAVQTSLKLLEEGGHISSGNDHGYAWIEVLDRARLRDLRVDWDKLESQRKLGLRQLDDVETYATGRGCRQTYLLNYFNSRPSYDGGCGHCDTCCGRPQYLDKQSGDKKYADKKYAGTPGDDSAETVVRKLLSGVARACGSGRNNATPMRVAAMLRGSSSVELKRRGLSELSTYGVLDSMNQQDLFDLVDACREQGLVQTAGGHRIDLSEAGVEVMKGDARVPVGLERHLERRLLEDS